MERSIFEFLLPTPSCPQSVAEIIVFSPRLLLHPSQCSTGQLGGEGREFPPSPLPPFLHLTIDRWPPGDYFLPFAYLSASLLRSWGNGVLHFFVVQPPDKRVLISAFFFASDPVLPIHRILLLCMVSQSVHGQSGPSFFPSSRAHAGRRLTPSSRTAGLFSAYEGSSPWKQPFPLSPRCFSAEEPLAVPPTLVFHVGPLPEIPSPLIPAATLNPFLPFRNPRDGTSASPSLTFSHRVTLRRSWEGLDFGFNLPSYSPFPFFFPKEVNLV